MNSSNCVPFSGLGSESSGTSSSGSVPAHTTDSSTESSSAETPSPTTCSPGSDASEGTCSAPQPATFGQLEILLEQDTRECYGCRRHRPLESFTIVRNKVGGKDEFRHRRCNQCRAKRQKESPHQLEKKRVWEAAKSRPCADCGRSFASECMDFDHVRGTKCYTISSAYRWASMENLVEEIAKCDVVCANCHRARTWHQQTPTGHPERAIWTP